MVSITRNVGDIASDDRQVFERVLGQKLQENQSVVIQVMDDVDDKQGSDQSANDNGSQSCSVEATLPDWVTIFADVPDEEMVELEALILARSEGRPS